MNTEQALQVLKQAIDLAVGAGAFKSAQDVSTIAKALEVVLNAFSPPTKQDNSGAIGPTPTKK